MGADEINREENQHSRDSQKYHLQDVERGYRRMWTDLHRRYFRIPLLLLLFQMPRVGGLHPDGVRGSPRAPGFSLLLYPLRVKFDWILDLISCGTHKRKERETHSRGIFSSCSPCMVLKSTIRGWSLIKSVSHVFPLALTNCALLSLWYRLPFICTGANLCNLCSSKPTF